MQENKEGKVFLRRVFLTTLTKKRLRDARDIMSEAIPQIEDNLDIALLGGTSSSLINEAKIKIEHCQAALKEASEKIKLLEFAMKSEQ